LDVINLCYFRTLLLTWFVVLTTIGCSQASDPAFTVSVSSDGRYVVSAHRDNKLILWDIQNKKATTISNKANIYSAYFVPNSDLFLWQSLDRMVHLRGVAGKALLNFTLPHDVYGHIMSSDQKTYISSDEGWGMYLGWGDSLKTLKAPDVGSFSGFGKLLNLQLFSATNTLISAGDSSPYYGTAKGYQFSVQKDKGYQELYGVTLWNTQTLEPIAKLPGNAAKTYATFSPDGKYVVSGCENVQLLTWSTTPTKLLYKADWLERDSKNQPPVPGEYIDFSHHHAIMSIKFIDENKFVRINASEPYAILYEINNPLPLKYLELGTSPFPAVSDYSRNAAIDSAPEAGVLVTGQRDGNGINVYQYDSAKQELERIWVTR